jgi:uncharacterized membrane protein YhaH (DUF805 family)
MTNADPAAPAPSSVPLDKPLYGASFTQAIKRFFAKYATFSGRASRSEFWWASFFVFLIAVLIWGPGIIVGIVTGTPGVDPTTGRATHTPGPAFLLFVGLGVLFYLAVLVPSIAITVRRLHDANFSGAFYLLVFVPWIGGLILLVLALLESKPEGARFDADAQPYQPVTPPISP